MVDDPPASKPTPRHPWRRRLLWSVVALAAALVALVAAALVHPWVLVGPVNRALGGVALSVVVDDARLESSGGWFGPWRWRVEGFALLSDAQGTPSLMARTLWIDPPDLRRSWVERSVVLPHVHAVGLILSSPEPDPPQPAAEKDAWPVRALRIDLATLTDFSLVMRDPAGVPIALTGVDGYLRGFAYDFGRREMVGQGAAHADRLGVERIAASEVHAPTIAFAGRTLRARGAGTVVGERTAVEITITGLFRPGAGIDARFEVRDADLERVLALILDASTSEVTGRLWGAATIRSRPPDATVDLRVRVEDATIRLPDDAGPVLRAALKLAPFVTLTAGHVGLAPLSGRIGIDDGVIVLTEGLYEAASTTATVDGRLSAHEVHARARFAPHSGSPWGLLISGAPDAPKVHLAGADVLDAWTLHGASTPRAIREKARADGEE